MEGGLIIWKLKQLEGGSWGIPGESLCMPPLFWGGPFEDSQLKLKVTPSPNLGVTKLHELC